MLEPKTSLSQSSYSKIKTLGRGEIHKRTNPNRLSYSKQLISIQDNN